MIAEVVFHLPLDRSFHYLVPEPLHAVLQPGMRVVAPFGARERMGFVVRFVERSPLRTLKAIRRAIDPMPVIAEERWALASWLSGHYHCSLGEALALMVPSELRLALPPSDVGGGSTPGTPMPASSGARGGGEAAAQDGGSVPTVLSAHQRQALRVILSALETQRARTILIHGVTASGKTELYLQAIERVLRDGRSAVYLIPEIALTPQAIDRFRERFGDGVAVWHSRLSRRARSLTWSRVDAGACRVVIGARSAVFAPVRQLGVIILDEEHEPTYKQEGAPYTHAREVAQARARLTGALVLLGSATPSVESYFEASRRRGGLVVLPERVEGRALPTVEIIDMREEWAGGRRGSPLSLRLQRLLQQAVERGEQAMLLLNRRGFARVAQCHACGVAVRCRHCAVPLVYHAGRAALVCHYCNFQATLTELCPACKTGYLRLRGAGTERVESELHRFFPLGSIARMDRDTMKHPESHRQVYEAVKSQQVGLLVGTQMIAKGLDFPQVTLVGVVSADTALNLPDFRSGERTFDLLTQMAGRAGRGAQPGRVLVQTFCPGHYAIQAAGQHDYQRFYREEIAMRRRLMLPPFVHLVELTLRGASRQRLDEVAALLAARLRQRARQRRIVLLGPAPHRIPRLRRLYRVSILLKGKTVEALVGLLRQTLQPGRRFRGMPVAVNVDPL